MDSETITIERRKMDIRRKKQYNREYYNKVRKYVQKIEKCKLYNIEYNIEPFKIIIEEGPFYLQL